MKYLKHLKDECDLPHVAKAIAINLVILYFLSNSFSFAASFRHRLDYGKRKKAQSSSVFLNCRTVTVV